MEDLPSARSKNGRVGTRTNVNAPQRTSTNLNEPQRTSTLGYNKEAYTSAGYRDLKLNLVLECKGGEGHLLTEVQILLDSYGE